MRVFLLDASGGNAYSAGLSAALEALGVDVELCGSPSLPSATLVTYPLAGVRGRRGRKALQVVGGAARLLDRFARARPSVVHIQWATPLDVAYALLSSAGNVPVVFTAHNPTARGPGVASRQSQLMARADSVVVHGPELARELSNSHHVSGNKIATIPHGNYEHILRGITRDDARRNLNIALSETVFAFVGSLGRRKGVDTLLQAFDHYRRSGRSGTLVIAGTLVDEVHFRELKLLADELGVAPVWRISRDLLPADDLEMAIAASNQVVLPFREASQSGSAILGMTCGRCVVTSALGTLGRTIGDRGLITPPGDAAALAKAMTLAADDPGACDHYGRRARAYAQGHLAWRPIACETLGLYERVIEARRRRSAEPTEWNRNGIRGTR